MKYLDILKHIKAKKKLSIENDFVIGYFLSSRISPYFSAFFIKKGIVPNTITILMIVSGLIGSFLFLIDNRYIQICGILLMQLWFILDCSDGEVARETKKFSKFGTEFDYLAHLINHPLFCFCLYIYIDRLNIFNKYYLILLFSISIILELIYRNIATLFLLKDKKEVKKKKENLNKKPFKYLLKELFNFFILYPNFILISMLLILINPYIVIFYTIGNIFFTLIIVIKLLIKLLNIFYKESD